MVDLTKLPLPLQKLRMYQPSSQAKLIFLLVLFLGVGLAMRLYKIDSQSLWYDELHSIIPTDPSNSLASVIEYCKRDQPPAFFVMLYFWYNVFPYNEASGKVFCTIIGVFGIASMFFLGKEVGGKNTGLAAAFLTATNIYHAYYSQELRFYTLLFLVTSLSFFFFIRFIKAPTIRNQVFFTITSIILLYTHYFGLVVVLSQAIIFTIINLAYKRGIKFFLKGLACAVAAMVAFLPWMPTILSDIKTPSFWIPDPGPLFFVEYFELYFTGWWALSFKLILVQVLFLVLLYYLWTIVRKAIREKRIEIDHIVILGWVILTLLIPYLYTIYRMPMLEHRYTIITLPAILLMIAMGWAYINNVYLKVLLILFFVVCDLRVHHRYFKRYKKPQYREMASYIIRENTASYPVLSQDAWHFNYYFRKYNADYDALIPQHITVPDWLTDKEKIWVILPQYHLDKQQAELLNSDFQKEKDVQYAHVNAVLYTRKKK